jgi:capsid protein
MNVQTTRGIPLRADPDSIRSLSMRSLARASIATGLKAFDGGSLPGATPAADYLQRRGWHNDKVAHTLVRGASAPAMTSTTGWAQELAPISLALLETLKPMSAGATLLSEVLQVSLAGVAQIKLPTIHATPATFVGQGQPIKVSQLPTTPGAVLTPAKLATICALSREQMESSFAESLVTQALIDACAPGLDAVLFSNVAAVADLHPAGILVGATSVTPSTQTVPSEAMADDVSALVQAISTFAGNSNVTIVAAPAQATRLALCAEQMPFAVLMTKALAVGTCVAVANNALAAAIAEPAIDAAKSVALQFEDSTPGAINSAASRSIFQIDAVAIRVHQGVSWCIRDPAAVSYVSGTKW